MKHYAFALTIVSFFLTAIETRSCKPSNKTDQLISYTGIFVHHLLQLVVFVTPWTTYFRNKASLPFLLFYLFMFLYVFVQNNIINKNRAQSCVLSIMTNDTCNLPEESPLRDPLYYIGVKKDLQQYNRFYSLIVLGYVLYILTLIKARI
jgi:hypothetical protein